MYQETQWPQEKSELYHLLEMQMTALVADCPPVSALANAAALLWQALEDINWAGFYLLKGDTLLLGPFQGKPACTAIPLGKGVCGTAAASRQIQLVPDVHQFPGHIACDSASSAEIVLPMIKDGNLLGVLDIDSPVRNRFDEKDAEGLKQLCTILLEQVNWDNGIF